jgi:hypothetical protein
MAALDDETIYSDDEKFEILNSHLFHLTKQIETQNTNNKQAYKKMEQMQADIERLTTRLDTQNGTSTFEQLYSQMNRVIKDRVDTDITSRFMAYNASQEQYRSGMQDIVRNQVKRTEQIASEVQDAQADIRLLQKQNRQRQAQKDRSYWQKATGHQTTVDAALPALLAQLRAAE